MSGDHFVRVRYRHPGLDVDENRTAHEGEECVRVFIIFPYGHSTKRTLLLVTHGEEPSRKILVPHRPEELLGGGMEAGVQGRDTLASTVIERGRRTTFDRVGQLQLGLVLVFNPETTFGSRQRFEGDLRPRIPVVPVVLCVQGRIGWTICLISAPGHWSWGRMSDAPGLRKYVHRSPCFHHDRLVDRVRPPVHIPPYFPTIHDSSQECFPCLPAIL